MEGKLMSPADVASVLGVSRRTLYRWMKDGKIPSITVGEKIKRLDIDAVLLAITKKDGSNELSQKRVEAV